MHIIDKILLSAHFENKPPVLIDIGASGAINQKWKRIASYSICICFDADDRDFQIKENESSLYRNLITINRVVTTNNSCTATFYLTNSPYCSSTLEPEQLKLDPWIFRSLFDVTKKVELQTITVEHALEQAGINYIDWFKTDSQGIDLRLYSSLSFELKQNILAAEFEPGIIDAYKNEDKLFELMQQMKDEGFWLSNMKVLGTQRLNEKYITQFGNQRIQHFIPESPCWSELTYFKEARSFDVRQLLLLYVFALLENQFGFALEVSEALKLHTSDPLAAECREHVYNFLKNEPIKIRSHGRIKNFILKFLNG